jgi:Flp pilus assembly protein TadG
MGESDDVDPLQADPALAVAAERTDGQGARSDEDTVMKRTINEKARKLGSRRGNAMVESALSFLVLMFILIGIIEFGMGIYTYNYVSYAAREGTRYAATRGTQSGYAASEDAVRDWVRRHAMALDSSQVNVITSWSGSKNPGTNVTVRVTYPITPAVGLFLGAIDVWSESTMPIAQ